MEEALSRNPEVASVAASARAAKERAPQVSALPDPTVALGYENGGHGWALGADDDTGFRVTLSQALPGSGQRRFAKEVEIGATAGVGVLGAGLGSVFGLMAKSTHDDALTLCNAARLCDARDFRSPTGFAPPTQTSSSLASV